MRLVKAKLIKLTTSDGLLDFWEETPLGKVYIVDADSGEEVEMYNVDKNIYHKQRVISTVDPVTRKTTGWLPVECLEIEA